MGMFDTMNQGMGPAMGQGQPMANGGSFAQKQQMKANPIMKGRPGMGSQMGNLAQGVGNAVNAWQANKMQKPNNGLANPMAAISQQNAGMGGSKSMLMAKQLADKNKQEAATGGTIGGSYNQLLSAFPSLAQNRQTGINAGQDMNWMDKPGALTLPNGYGKPDVMPREPQSGLATLQSPYDAQQQEQVQQQAAANPMQSPMERAQEQMRGYEGPDLGSQDPRELARMSGGIGPSNPMQAMGQQVQMDENGLEPRRGAR